MDGRLSYMKMLRKDIFQFGQGVDTDVDRLGSSTSGVTLKFQYTLLELKAAGASVQLKKCINDILWYMIEDYNRKHKTSYSGEMINVCLRRNAITNDYETVQMIQMSEGLLSNETLKSYHPFVENISNEQ